MAMIQGIDAGALINAFRQGRSDRATADKAAADRAKQAQIGGLMGQLFPDGQAPSLSDQFATAQTPRQMQGFDQAFSPPAMEAIGRGETPPSAVAPAAPQAPRAAPQRAPDPNVLAKLIALDPETGGKIATALKTMDEMALKRLDTRNTAMGGAAFSLKRVPENERRAYLQSVLAPFLIERGWTEEEIAGKPLTDQALDGYIGQSMDVDRLTDNELAERQFQAGKVITPQPGAGAFVRRGDGTIETIVAPNDGSHAIGSPVQRSNIAQPRSKAEYDALPPGSRYQAPDGSMRTKPGGGASNGTDGFPAQQ